MAGSGCRDGGALRRLVPAMCVRQGGFNPTSPGRSVAPCDKQSGRGNVMAEVFEDLAKDHAEVKQMLAELEAGLTASSGATSDDLSMRKKMVEQLVIEESKHEALEEMYFWPAVREKLPDGDTLADTAIGQEQEGKEVLDKLDKLDAGDAEFEKLVTKFIKAGRTHITYEETQVWPSLRNALSADDASQIGTKIEQGKKTAPTRPHPHTPPSPGVLTSAGPLRRAADRARDKAAGRGE